MAKSKIIKDLVNNKVSLTVVLNRLYVLAFDLGNQEILDWTNKEISGYKQGHTERLQSPRNKLPRSIRRFLFSTTEYIALTAAHECRRAQAFMCRNRSRARKAIVTYDK